MACHVFNPFDGRFTKLFRWTFFRPVEILRWWLRLALLCLLKGVSDSGPPSHTKGPARTPTSQNCKVSRLHVAHQAETHVSSLCLLHNSRTGVLSPDRRPARWISTGYNHRFSCVDSASGLPFRQRWRGRGGCGNGRAPFGVHGSHLPSSQASAGNPGWNRATSLHASLGFWRHSSRRRFGKRKILVCHFDLNFDLGRGTDFLEVLMLSPTEKNWLLWRHILFHVRGTLSSGKSTESPRELYRKEYSTDDWGL